ncbi:hypothetical protein TNCV_2502421 [Trichonephila clavipes]|nr:hypothetical protein TNCV_2502421 [Trichonephila clavipes]
MEHMQSQCGHRKSEIPAQTRIPPPSITVSFNSVGLMTCIVKTISHRSSGDSSSLMLLKVVYNKLRHSSGSSTLRAERARKRSFAGVVARGRPGTGLLDTESSDWY